MLAHPCTPQMLSYTQMHARQARDRVVHTEASAGALSTCGTRGERPAGTGVEMGTPARTGEEKLAALLADVSVRKACAREDQATLDLARHEKIKSGRVWAALGRPL